MTSTEHIQQLYARRPKSRFATVALSACTLITAYSWLASDLFTGGMWSDRRSANLARFIQDIVPFPLQGQALDWTVAYEWGSKLFYDKGAEALVVTLSIAVLAIFLAAVWGIVLSVPAARNLMARDPIHSPKRTNRSASLAVLSTRALMIVLRAVPEYIWAFLFVRTLGFTVWPAVFALALHNAGILGKLMAETNEDAPPNPTAALETLGAGRIQRYGFAVLPDVFGRYLAYFFYRWETCVREASVLGMLGIVSIGALVRDARAANFYDEMVFFVLLSATLVALGDIVSNLSRAWIRRSG